ncbi:MAG: hypothetical protein IPJ65_32885 [Archangiaceae bacterium]|nr:hypothetical protein [Archangiaceae bacterium]
MKTRLAAVALCAFASACTSTQVLVPPEQRAALKRELEGQDRFLKLSFYATPFFGDATKRLLTPVPPEQVRLLEQPDGTPISPGEVESVFAAGTMVRIKVLEFPTALAQTERVMLTPRSQPWLYLDVAGTAKDAPPYVLVLRQAIKDDRELDAEVDRWLSREDPRRKLQSFSEAIQTAIAGKKVVLDMPADALEMAWGYPDRRVYAVEGEKKKETWIWPGQKQVVLLDGRVAEVPGQ